MSVTAYALPEHASATAAAAAVPTWQRRARGPLRPGRLLSSRARVSPRGFARTVQGPPAVACCERNSPHMHFGSDETADT